MSAPGHSAETRLPPILLAESDEAGPTHIRELLARSGYQFVVARDGTQALEILESEYPPSLAVLECRLPGVSAIDICRRIRQTKRGTYTYVIVLTPWHQQPDRIAALEAGADECLYKPVDVRELRARLEAGSRIILERALRESEERFRSAFEFSGTGMAFLRTTGEFMQVNRALCKFLGYSPAELWARALPSVSHPEDVPDCATLLNGFLCTAPRTGEFVRRFIAKDGSVVWAEFALSIVHDADQECAYLFAQFRDVTTRKTAEEALRRSEALSRAITENVSDLILVRDLDYRCRYASPSYLACLGYSPGELSQSDAALLVHPDDLPMVQQTVASVRADQQARVMTLRYRHKNGSFRHVESNISLLRGPEGAPEGFVVVSRVIDERIVAEQKLQMAYAETELFLQSIPSILIGLDGDGRVTQWNPIAARVLGLSKEEVLGKAIYECGLKWLHPEMELEVKRWLQTESTYRCDNLAFERDGKIRFLGLNVRRIPIQAEDMPRFVVTGADITERKTMEVQLRQAQKLEAIGQLAAGIAHEINTPTQYVGDNTRFLRDSWHSIARLLELSREIEAGARRGVMPPEILSEYEALVKGCDLDYLLEEIPRAIDQSMDGVQRVTKIVLGMKEFSHPGGEEKRAVDINRAIETTLTVARHEWKYVADMVTDFDENLPLVPCLIGEFNQVILNLIVNAAHAISGDQQEHAAEKGRITVSTRREQGWAEIRVQDTGNGIPENIRSRIFEPFFTTKPMGRGTGQGLALAHSVIVNRHQGQIWFESELGKGTTFFVRLPLQAGAPVS